VRLVLATRRSPLALAQTGMVAAALRSAGHEVELLPLVTDGDRRSREAAVEGSSTDEVKGLFVRELEEALLDGRADLAVHSAKDMPTELPPGLSIVAVPLRADPRDVYVGPVGGLEALPEGAVVGTGSPRRQAQLRDYHPHLRATEIRGNIDTRVKKMLSGEVSALILAAAGLARLGLEVEGAVPLDPTGWVPAPGQGCLALEAVEAREDVATALAAVNHADSLLALRAERAFLKALGGGCQTPAGALATMNGDRMTMTTYVAAPGESGVRRTATATTNEAEVLGASLGRPE
jgi:hydroxymethylbilane synthase